jgi:hypothetical protein
MVAQAIIREPFTLASYTSSSRGKLKQISENVYATYHRKASSSSDDGYVTVAAQADGLHVLDVRPSL